MSLNIDMPLISSFIVQQPWDSRPYRRYQCGELTRLAAQAHDSAFALPNAGVQLSLLMNSPPDHSTAPELSFYPFTHHDLIESWVDPLRCHDPKSSLLTVYGPRKPVSPAGLPRSAVAEPFHAPSASEMDALTAVFHSGDRIHPALPPRGRQAMRIELRQPQTLDVGHGTHPALVLGASHSLFPQ
jgi:hypothetical protein